LASALAATILVTTASMISLVLFKAINPEGALWKVFFYSA
jgi:hypothetical protein